MHRGDVFLAKGKGDFGKIRPTVIVQSSKSIGSAATVTVCLMTSKLIDNSLVRLTVEPTAQNGLEKTSQVQFDKLQTLPKDRFITKLGNLTSFEIAQIDLGIATHLNLYALAPNQGDTP